MVARAALQQGIDSLDCPVRVYRPYAVASVLGEGCLTTEAVSHIKI